MWLNSKCVKYDIGPTSAIIVTKNLCDWFWQTSLVRWSRIMRAWPPMAQSWTKPLYLGKLGRLHRALKLSPILEHSMVTRSQKYFTRFRYVPGSQSRITKQTHDAIAHETSNPLKSKHRSESYPRFTYRSHTKQAFRRIKYPTLLCSGRLLLSPKHDPVPSSIS